MGKVNSHNAPGVVTCPCNPANMKAEFRNVVDSIPVGGNSPSIVGWTVIL